MTNLNPIEKRFKDALEDFQELEPSGHVYGRIERSLIKKRLRPGKGWKRFSLLLLLLFTFGWAVFSIITPKTNSLHFKSRTSSSTIYTYASKGKIATTKINSNTSSLTQTSVSIPVSVPSGDSTPATHDTTPDQYNTAITNTISAHENTSVLPINPRASSSETVTEFNKADIPELAPKTTQPDELFELNGRLHLLYSRDFDFRSGNPDLSMEYKKKEYLKPIRRRKVEFPMGGLSYSISVLNAKDPEWQENADYRKRTESPLLSYHIGTNISYYHKNWFVRGGLHYNNIADEVQQLIETDRLIRQTSTRYITKEYYSWDTTYWPSIPAPIIIKNHDSTTTTEVTNVYTDTTKDMATYSYRNEYSYIEIPLMLGYDFSYKRFSFDIAAGISWAQLVRYKAHYPDKELSELLDMRNYKDHIRSTTWNGVLGVGISYYMKEDMEIFLRPEFRYNLNSMLTEDIPIDQRYLQMRLSAGLRYNL